MNLSKPVFDSILQIDNRLQELQKEVLDMENEFGFQKDTDFKKLKQKKVQNKDQNRYQNLVDLKVQEVQKKIIKPQISDKWTELFSEEPNNMDYFDKNEYLPTFKDDKDFSIKLQFDLNTNLIDDHMSQYALNFQKD